MFNNETNLCGASGDFEMEPMEGYTIIASEEQYNPADIRLVDGKIEKIQPPPFNPDEYKIPIYTLINDYVSQLIQSGFKSSASGKELIYDSLVLDQQNILIMAKSMNSPVEVRARETINSAKEVITLTNEQMQILLTDLSNWIAECKKTGWELQGKLAKLTRKEEIDGFKLQLYAFNI